MDPLYEEKYHELERNYWWFKARREAIYKLLNFYDIKYNSKILDIGCSSGLLLQELHQQGFPKKNLHGIDISNNAVEIAKSNGFKNVQIMDGSKLTFKNESMDIIISSDSLEHIKWDKKALKQWHQCLKPGGMLIVFVPAFNFLWSEHDEINNHYRRYNHRTLGRRINKSGFKTKKLGYWNSLLFIPMASYRLIKSMFFSSKKDDLGETSTIFNKIMFNILHIENNFLTRVNYPVGLSVFCIAFKE